MSEATKRARAMLAMVLLPKSAKDVIKDLLDRADEQEQRMQALEQGFAGLGQGFAGLGQGFAGLGQGFGQDGENAKVDMP